MYSSSGEFIDRLSCKVKYRITDAGFGKLDVKILDNKGEEVPIELWKKDGETRVQYAPTEPGKLKFNVLYNGTLVPNGE